MLEEAGLAVQLVNASQARNLPGRPKTDLLTELPDRVFRVVRAASGRCWLGSVLVINDGDVPRELSGLVVPLRGSLEATGDLFVPYRLVDGDGVVVGPVAAFFAELAACGRPATTQRSYGMDLLRWFRFLWAIGVGWDQATRVEARDFCRWLQVDGQAGAAALAVSRPAALRDRVVVPAAAGVNAVTGKPSRGDRYEAATVAHCESVLRGFYDFHLEAGTGPMVNPFPLARHRRAGRGQRASQPDGAVRRAAQRPVPAEGRDAGAAAHPGRAVRRVVRAAGFAP